MSFLTVEDVNSTLIKYGHVNMFHTINTKDISLDEFSGVKYDFCEVNHSISNNRHYFTFKIVNSNWTGAYYFTKDNGEYIDADATFNVNTNSIILISDESSVKLVLYCTTLADTFKFVRITWKPINLSSVSTTSINSSSEDIPVISLINEDLTGKSYTVKSKSKNQGSAISSYETFGLNDEGEFTVCQNASPSSKMNSITYSGVTFYFDVFIHKVSPTIAVVDNLLVGKTNRVVLSVPDDFTGSNEIIAQNQMPLLKGVVYYDDKSIPLQYDGEYYFDLDLTEKMNDSSVKLKLEIIETEYIRGEFYILVVSSDYVSVDNISDFISELSAGGSKIIELTGDFSLVDDITVSHDIIIRGNNHKLDLNQHSILLADGITLKANSLTFSNGDSAIIQNQNTILDLAECTFENCKSDNYNNLGSCIFCDVDLESLSVDDDFTTTLVDCSFINNHSSILHGGQLNVDNCRFRNTDVNVLDMNNPTFLYQVDGDATVINSVFDIDISSDDLCANSENIGFSQALVMCGESATINTATHSSLQSDNSLPFFNSPYNNRSHLFVKYYYPNIGSCVFSSPSVDYEDMCCCHCVSGVDWVFKNNVEISKCSWNSENAVRKIVWGD